MPKRDDHDINTATLKIYQLAPMATLAYNSSELHILWQGIPLYPVAALHATLITFQHLNLVVLIELTHQLSGSLLEVFFG